MCTEYVNKQSVQLKDDLVELLVNELGPIQNKMKELKNDITYVDKILSTGSVRATELAKTNYNQIETAIGLS